MIEDEEELTWMDLAQMKGRRAKRRQDDALKDAGHLNAYFQSQCGPQQWIGADTATFKQLQRSHRHSCHAGCCSIQRYVKRQDRRQDRHQVHMSLVKFYYAYRRKINWVSTADYKGM